MCNAWLAGVHENPKSLAPSPWHLLSEHSLQDLRILIPKKEKPYSTSHVKKKPHLKGILTWTVLKLPVFGLQQISALQKERARDRERQKEHDALSKQYIGALRLHCDARHRRRVSCSCPGRSSAWYEHYRAGEAPAGQAFRRVGVYISHAPTGE